MSERGSFVSEYVGCTKCADAVRKAVADHVPFNGKFLTAQMIESDGGVSINGETRSSFPIVAGKVGGSYSLDIETLEEFIDTIENCHDIGFVVYQDSLASRPTVTFLRAASNE